MYLIIGNFGNETIALIEWARQNRLKNVYCLYVDTSWASKSWPKRVTTVVQWLKSINFTPVILTPNISFQALALEQRDFPTPKFASCVSLIKAPTLLAWIEKHDPNAEATLLLAKRRQAARAYAHIFEYIKNSAHYNKRTIWQPLYKHSNAERDTLLQQAGFLRLEHNQSQECFPCIHCPQQIVALDDPKINQIQALEKKIDQSMFEQDIISMKQTLARADTTPNKHLSESLISACGAPFGCGL